MRQLPQHVIDKMSAEDRKRLALQSTDEIKASRAKNDDKAEKVIQQEVEAYLVQLGYEPRTPDSIKRGTPKSGWWIHLNQTKRNPILCDLLILGNDGRFLELELKTKNGPVTQEQACLIIGGAQIARSSLIAASIVKEWHETRFMA